MKLYRNISGSMLPLDCLSYTKYIMPGETAALPNSRDVRHYARQGKLVLVRSGVEVKPRKKKRRYRPRPPKKVGPKKNQNRKNNQQRRLNNGH